MNLTIKSGSLLAVASIMLVLIFGTDTLSHVKAAAQTARDHLFGILSTEHLVKVGREQLAGQKDKLLNAEVGLEKQRDRVKAAETGLQELDARLAESRRRLGLLRPPTSRPTSRPSSTLRSALARPANSTRHGSKACVMR